MRAGARQKLPREIELEQKRYELAALRARHVAARAALQRLRDEIAQFERDYDRTLGRRMAELERIEAEIARLGGPRAETDARFESGASGQGSGGFEQSRAGAARDSGAAGAREGAWKSEVQDIKSLYREVAKAIHPDLACAGPAKLVRHELMSKANRAYADLDRRTLQEILRKWRVSHGLAEDGAGRDELARLVGEISRERQALGAVDEMVAELRGSYACRFKLRADAGLAHGSDLFADLLAVADLNIARALRRLAALKLKGEKPQGPLAKRPRQCRNLCFPAGLSCGTLYLRDRTSVSYNRWQQVGPAIGSIEIDCDKSVRLDVKERAATGLAWLRQLKPYDLQSLFLYDVCDTDLDSIVHLTGLDELYLSGPRLTDSALSAISSLVNLKRIYIYQTGISDSGLVYLKSLPSLTGLTSSGNSITDAGLAGLERAIPRVKTVSFQWKR